MLYRSLLVMKRRSFNFVGTCRAQEVLNQMGIKASRQYTKQPRSKGGVGQGRQPQQDGGGHASSVADVLKAEAGLVKSEAHANGLTGAIEEAGMHVNSEAHASGLTGAAEGAGRQVKSEAHANGVGHAQEVVPMDAQGVKPEPSACTTGFDQQEQQPSVKRQRVNDGGAAVSMPVDGVGAVLFDVAKQCKEEVFCQFHLPVVAHLPSSNSVSICSAAEHLSHCIRQAIYMPALQLSPHE